jgi:hypothetical protein
LIAEVFKKGFVVFKKDTSHLLPVVEGLSISLESGLYGTDLTQRFLLDPTTQPLTVLGVSDPTVDLFFESFGYFSSKHIIFHKYHQTKAMGWHHDVFDRSLLLALVYLGTEDFEFSDGGVLELARCCVDKNGMPVSEPEVFERILPNPDTVVFINNTDPTLLHRVTPLIVPKTRMVLSGQLGIAEVMLKKE